jgi:hypothetical protein
MSDKSYERAVQLLKERIGSRWEGADVDGRKEMAEVLERHMGVSRGDADDLIDALVDSGELRYHREGLADGVPGVLPAAPTTGVGGSPVGTGTSGAAGAPVVPLAITPGYWQIGSGGSEGGAEPLVREGQIDPTR